MQEKLPTDKSRLLEMFKNEPSKKINDGVVELLKERDKLGKDKIELRKEYDEAVRFLQELWLETARGEGSVEIGSEGDLKGLSDILLREHGLKSVDPKVGLYEVVGKGGKK